MLKTANPLEHALVPLNPVYASSSYRPPAAHAPLSPAARVLGLGLMAQASHLPHTSYTPPLPHAHAHVHSSAHAHSPLHEPDTVLARFDAGVLARAAADLGVAREPAFSAQAWDAAVGWLDTLLERLVNVYGWQLHANAVTSGPNAVALESFDTMFPIFTSSSPPPAPPGATIYIAGGTWHVAASALDTTPPVLDLVSYAQCVLPHALVVRGRGLPSRCWLLQHEHVVRDTLGDAHFRRLLEGLCAEH